LTKRASPKKQRTDVIVLQKAGTMCRLKYKDMSIRSKLRAIIMLVSLSILVVAGAAFVVYGHVTLRHQMVRDIQIQANIIGDNCRAALAFDDTLDAEDTMSSLRENPSIILAQLFKGDDELVAIYKKEGIDEHFEFITCEVDEHSFRRGYLALSQTIVVNDMPAGHIYILSSLDHINAIMKQNIAVVISLTLVLSVVAYITSVILEKGISGPILKLSETTRNIITSKCYSKCDIEHGRDEIGLLIKSFNSMINDLKQRTTSVERLNTANRELESEIVERKEAEEKLQIFRRFAEESSNGVGLVDIDGNVLFINPALCKIFGEEHPEDTYGKSVARYYDEKTQKRLAEEIFPDTIAKGRWTGELNVIRKNGEVVPTLNSLSSICNDEGEPFCFSNSLTDLTESIQIEKERQSYTAELEKAKDLAEAANKAKSEFLANMSHEIRTPMNSIIGFSDMLSDENMPQEQRENVSIIRESAASLLHLINDILDSSKIEAGQLDVERTDCSLGKLLNSIDSMMKARAYEKCLDFKIMANKDVPAQLYSDPYRLKQCLINLTDNALKFTEQGYVHLQVSLHKDNGQHFIRFDVEDTGIGIPEDRQVAIFESFTQVDGSTTRKYGGTGLGLTVTKQLAELLGGELSLSSEEGNGSIFSLSIPTGVDITGQPLLDPAKTLDQGVDESQKTETTLFSGRVLVAEDVEGSQILMKLMLTKLGVEVVIAEDGNQALQKALSQSFDLILMDMQMPHVNGYEATAALRQRGYETPIVALTAHAMKGDDQECLEAGCDGYLTKPIDRRELPRLLAQYLPTRQETADKTFESTRPKAYEPKKHDSEPSLSKAPSSEFDDPNISKIINWDWLINNLGDVDLVREILPTYLKNIQEHFAKLSHAIGNGDCESIASHAHALKGVGRNLHIESLFDIAGQMECASRENNIETSTILLNNLQTEIERIVVCLSQCDWLEKKTMI